MKILALELSSARGSVAWLDNHMPSAPTAGREGACAPQKGEFFHEWPNDRKNSRPFFEHLADVQKEFGKSDTIIVGLGPGSYAGTRIAISAAIGLSFGGRHAVNANPARTAQNLGHESAHPLIKLIGYPSICAIECDANEYCVIGDARRQTFFFARVRDNGLIDEPFLMSQAELREKLAKLNKKMLILTTEKLPQFDRAEVCYPSAKILAQLAVDAKRKFAQPPLEPIYLREPHITIPNK
jgi:tRNA threonylcarbamoyladenosine biosynthesis protein TsaB